MTSERIAVVGAGSIGVAFCVLFASAGFEVGLWDALPEALPRARANIASRLQLLAARGMLDDEANVVAARVYVEDELSHAVAGATLVQECAPERLELKRELFSRLAGLTGPDTVLATSSSALTAGVIAGDGAAADRTLVGHPGNPPYLLPVIEVVPSPSTSDAATATAERVYRSAGLEVVRVRKEVEGFVFNRLQGALLREAYCLVRDRVADVADIDAIVRLGLGRRWSVIGPFETSDLNTRGGIESHAEKMGPAYERMGSERGQYDPWTPELVAEVTRQRRALLPLDEWDDRVRWRDEQLLDIAARDRVEGAS